ncbi:MAG: HNH endonuclease [Actinomycetota bacterium]
MYESRLKKMPVPVLKRHEVLVKNGNLISLNTHELSLEERRAIISECESKISEFIKARGLTTWSGLLELDPVPESIRYQVLKRDRRCVLCGAGTDSGPLQVDHIVPRSQGGSNDLSNLQVLCALCNRGKSNRDDEDFRLKRHSG